jgi:hypothetical protein
LRARVVAEHERTAASRRRPLLALEEPAIDDEQLTYSL